ncbi:MAG: lipid-A-disaccharide synthase [Rickettsiales bacterium]|jgi:lipid-A-disaccharide synthase|nr:lipid-A-disaccharide synthase [Rickettsiales bacterium]
MNQKSKKVFIMAGEVSGDVLGGGIMRACENGRVNFVGLGGDCMKAAGLKTIFPISDLAVMGVVEVLMKSRTLLKRIGQTATAVLKEKPDIVLTIDAPSFAARVVKRVRPYLPNTKFYHVVAPQVWAWAPKRAKKYAKIFDKLFCFFDFEKPYFTKYGLETAAVGHPAYDVMKPGKDKGARPYIALLPGSRMSEVRRMMPVYRGVVEKMSAENFAIPTTETTKDFISREIKTWGRGPKLFAFGNRRKLYAAAKLAVVKSGTGAAELAMMNVPAVVVYKVNWLTEIIFRLVIRVRYASLVNILANRKIFPELLGWKATAENIIEELGKIDTKKMIAELKSADKLWHKSESPTKLIASALTDSN